MKLMKTTLVTAALTLISTSAFAGSEASNSTAPLVTNTVSSSNTTHVVKAPVLLDANPYATKTTKHRIVRKVYEPIEQPAARDASMSADGKFLYRYVKNVNTKTYRPTASASDAMPNLFKK